MFEELNRFLVFMRPAFSRRATYGWFVVVFVGLILRSDTYGVSSIVRALALASTVFLTCVEVFMFGVFCVLDSLFSLLVTASVISFFLACMAPNPRARLAYLIGCGIFCGLAFLTKGFLSIVLLLLTIVPFMLWEHRWKDLIKSLWIPLVFAILMVLPWGIMIYRRESDFWYYFLWEEHIQRFLSSHAQHARPFWFFIPILLAGVFPWTPLIPLTIDGLKKRFREIPFLRFSLCWLVFPFLFFSICRGKLGSYIPTEKEICGLR